LGGIDDFAIAEVLTLAAESLRCISEESILDISHLGIVTALIEALGVPGSRRDELLKCIGEKNGHELTALCRSCGLEEERIRVLRELLSISGAPERVLPRVRELVGEFIGCDCVEQLERVTAVLKENGCGDLLRIDFSAVDDIHYYNGIVFKGFVRSLPDSVLAGGQYDKLMRKMGRRSGAIGFAVYMDELERLERERREYDVDVLLLYREGDSLSEIAAARRAILENGESVLVQRSIPLNTRYKRLCEVSK
jgi:ATP phosphoribosyltransferase regulatory subunit